MKLGAEEQVVAHDGEVTSGVLFHLLSRAFSSPTEMTPQMVEEFRNLIQGFPESICPAALNMANCWELAIDEPDKTLLAYSRLFLGPFEILSPPYASIYLEADQKLMGETSAAVARIYSDAGLGPGSGPNEVPDHIALEWEFLYYLTNKYLVTHQDQWLRLRHSFLDEHMRSWVKEFSRRIMKANINPFYTALAEFQLQLFSDH